MGHAGYITIASEIIHPLFVEDVLLDLRKRCWTCWNSMQDMFDNPMNVPVDPANTKLLGVSCLRCGSKIPGHVEWDRDKLVFYSKSLGDKKLKPEDMPPDLREKYSMKQVPIFPIYNHDVEDPKLVTLVRNISNLFNPGLNPFREYARIIGKERKKEYYSINNLMSAMRKLYIKEGELVLFNRQPSLKRQSILAVRALERPDDELVISFNPFLCRGFNADFDGDEMNVFVIHKKDQLELESMLPQNNTIDLLSEKLLLYPHQDCILGLEYKYPQAKNRIITKVQEDVNSVRDIQREAYQLLKDNKSSLTNFSESIRRIIKSEARGSESNWRSMFVSLGEQVVGSSTKVEGSKIVNGNYEQGLDFNEYFTHMQSTRESICSIGVVTASSGYISKKLCRIMENMRKKIREIPEEFLSKNKLIVKAKELLGPDGYLLSITSQGIVVTDFESVWKIRSSPNERLEYESKVLGILCKKSTSFRVPRVISFKKEDDIVILQTSFIDGIDINQVNHKFFSNVVESVRSIREEISSLISEDKARDISIKFSKTDSQSYIDRFNARLKYFPGVVDDDLSIKFIRELDKLPETSDIRFCHNDMHSENLIFSQDGKVEAVIDWEDCSMSHPACDVCHNQRS
ncbi:hypothetical protein BX667DRAFT_510591 [Coemansia mojavensis]|nr:hypothetical protein BX667DRAFT_510591 [Coemansia mojavensis]